MNSTAYSHRPLIEKLGIKPDMRLYIKNAPAGYLADSSDWPEGIEMTESFRPPYDFIQYFASEQSNLASAFPKLVKALQPNGMVWVSWPKGASGVPTDLNENIIRDIGLANGVVDVKVIAVDEIWSGLKFVFRLADRR